MTSAVQMICIVNQEQFNWKDSLQNCFQLDELDIGFQHGECCIVNLTTPKEIAEEFHQDIESMKTLNIAEPEDREIFNSVLNKYSDYLYYLLPDGRFYRHGEILEMLSSKFDGITGGVRQVTFTETDPYGAPGRIRTHDPLVRSS